MPSPGSATSPRIPLPPALRASSTGPPGPWRIALDTSSVTIISTRQRSSGSTLVSATASRTAWRARAGACGVAGNSREIDATSVRYPDRAQLRAYSLANDALDLATVGAAFRCLHHSSDDGPDRLVVAALDLLDGVGVVGHRLLDDLLEFVAAGLRQAAVRHDRRR